MNDFPQLAVHFKLNDEVITLNLPDDDSDILFKMTNDDEYTVRYINNLISNGFISLSEELKNIYRVYEDGSESLIHGQDEQNLESTAATISTPQGKHISEWTDEETRLLLDKYEQLISQVGPLKRFKTKRVMWATIAEHLSKFFNTCKTGIQCENRYKTVLKRKKTAVDNNLTSGSSRAIVPFEEELNKIAALDDSIEPEVVGTSRGVTTLKRAHEGSHTPDTDEPLSNSPTPSDQSSTSGVGKRRKSLSVQETLERIFRQKEEARERRHKEKLDLIRELFTK